MDLGVAWLGIILVLLSLVLVLVLLFIQLIIWLVGVFLAKVVQVDWVQVVRLLLSQVHTLSLVLSWSGPSLTMLIIVQDLILDLSGWELKQDLNSEHLVPLQ